jgi:hypothetical protein
MPPLATQRALIRETLIRRSAAYVMLCFQCVTKDGCAANFSFLHASWRCGNPSVFTSPL